MISQSMRRRLLQASARRRGDRRHLSHHHQRPLRPKSPRARSTNSARCSTSHATRSARELPARQWDLGGRLPSRPHGSPAWQPPVAPPRFWWRPRPRRSRSANRRRWRSRIFRASRKLERSLDHRLLQYPDRRGQGYPPDTLLRMCESRSRTSGPSRIGAGTHSSTNGTCAHCKSLPRPVNVLSTHSAWRGEPRSCSAAPACSPAGGSVIPDLQSALFRAVRSNLILRKHAASTIAFTHSPGCSIPSRGLDMHNRMKEALVLLGRQKRASSRPPLTKDRRCGNRARIRQALLEGRACCARKPTPPSRRASFQGDALRHVAPHRAAPRRTAANTHRGCASAFG